jgi:hypothetical protein
MAPRRAAVVGEGRSEGEISGAFVGDEVVIARMSMLQDVYVIRQLAILLDTLQDVYVNRQLGSVAA